MAERVGAHTPGDSAGSGAPPHHLVDAPHPERAPSRAHEQRPGSRVTARGEISFQSPRRFGAERHDAFLASLADHAHGLRRSVDVVEGEPGQLGHAQASGVEQLEDRAIALVQTPIVEQRVRFIDGKKGDQLPPESGSSHGDRRITFEPAAASEEFHPAPHGGELARDRHGIESATMQVGQPGANLALVHGVQIHRRALIGLASSALTIAGWGQRPEMVTELIEIGPITPERVR